MEIVRTAKERNLREEIKQNGHKTYLEDSSALSVGGSI